MRKINKPIKFFGLSSGQFAIFMLLTAIIIIVSIFKQLHLILIIGIISAILFLSGLLFQTLKKEHKAGNPDYLTGLRIKNATPADNGQTADFQIHPKTATMIGIIILISLLICALCLLIALLYIRQTEIEVKDKSVDLESVLPIQTITENAVINGNGDITVGYRLLLPEVFTLSESEAQYIHERLEAL